MFLLETTLATRFTPGSNLKGKVAGANWAFLLPSLDLQQVLCIGMPLPTTFNTLSSFSQEIKIMALDGKQKIEALSARLPNLEMSNVKLLSQTGDGAWPFADHSVDLVLLVDQGAVDWLTAQPVRLAEVQRALRRNGFIYVEQRGRYSLFQKKRSRDFLLGFGERHHFWLTPYQGEMHTAVPLADTATVEYFRRQKFYSLAFKPRLYLKDLLVRFGYGRRSSHREIQPRAIKTSNKPTQAKLGRAFLKRTAVAFTHGVEHAEEALEQRLLTHPFTLRQGVLAANQPNVDDARQPLHYLYALANASGIDLAGYRWGLSARGEYSSRKLLFFFFDPANKAASATPQYIVKMVRDPALNLRLENEAKALRWLQAHGIGDRETLPQVAFAGHHAQLAIVGESVIGGLPFRQKSDATPACPYLHAAVDWLTDLGATTADAKAAASYEVANTLHLLFQQFVEIYQPAADESAFLAEQISQFAKCLRPMPLVFQHGDPGTWNVMATESGKAAFLDWEAAEIQGMPLWDLFYFLRSYSVGAARAYGKADALSSFTQLLSGEAPMSEFFYKATVRYCQAVGIEPSLIVPLFYTCWMHRSLKEANRLPAAKLNEGHYVSLLRLAIQYHNSPLLQRLFAMHKK